MIWMEKLIPVLSVGIGIVFIMRTWHEQQRTIDEGNQEATSVEPVDFDLFELPPGTTEGLV
jgi:hypothetical protein